MSIILWNNAPIGTLFAFINQVQIPFAHLSGGLVFGHLEDLMYEGPYVKGKRHGQSGLRYSE